MSEMLHVLCEYTFIALPYTSIAHKNVWDGFRMKKVGYIYENYFNVNFRMWEQIKNY